MEADILLASMLSKVVNLELHSATVATRSSWRTPALDMAAFVVLLYPTQPHDTKHHCSEDGVSRRARCYSLPLTAKYINARDYCTLDVSLETLQP